MTWEIYPTTCPGQGHGLPVLGFSAYCQLGGQGFLWLLEGPPNGYIGEAPVFLIGETPIRG